ncbi:MAG: hypothetical protein V3S89_03390 [Desulfobacterales bacterium]
MKSIVLGVLIILIFASQGFCFVTDTTAWEPSSGLLTAYESGRDMPLQSGSHYDQDLFVTTMTLMVPGEKFGFGIEVPRIHKRLRILGSDSVEKSVDYETWGDVKIVAKYQFGVYRPYRFLGKDRLLNILVSLVGKLKLPTASTDLATLGNTPLPVKLQPGNGSTDATLGFMVHFDSREYFRIHSHIMYSFPVSHDGFRPGESLHYTLDFMMVKLGIKDQFYPTIGIEGMWHASSKMAGAVMKKTEGVNLYLNPGIQSSWWYFSSLEMFMMIESGVQIRLVDTSDAMPGPDYGCYIGMRVYFR